MKSTLQRLQVTLAGPTARNSGVALLDQALLSGTNFAVGFFLARQCSPSDYGAYVLATSILLFVNGFQLALITGPLMVLGVSLSPSDERRYFSSLFIAQVIFVVLVGIVIAFVDMSGLKELLHLDPLLSSLFPILIFALIASQLQEFFRKLLFTRQLLKKVLLNDLIYIAVYGIGLFLAWKTSIGPDISDPASSFSVQGAFLCFGVAAICAMGFGFAQVRTLKLPNLHEFKEAVGKNWKFGKWGFGSAWLGFAGNQAVLWVIGGLEGFRGAATYELARLVSGPIQVMQFAFGNILNVRSAMKFKQESAHSVQKFLRLGLFVGLIFSVGYFGIVFVGVEPFLRTFLRGRYQGMMLPIIFFGLYYLITWVGTTQSAFVNAVHRPSINLLGLLVNSLVALPCSFFLIPKFGAAGGIGAMVMAQMANVVVKEIQILRFTQQHETSSASIR